MLPRRTVPSCPCTVGPCVREGDISVRLFSLSVLVWRSVDTLWTLLLRQKEDRSNGTQPHLGFVLVPFHLLSPGRWWCTAVMLRATSKNQIMWACMDPNHGLTKSFCGYVGQFDFEVIPSSRRKKKKKLNFFHSQVYPHVAVLWRRNRLPGASLPKSHCSCSRLLVLFLWSHWNVPFICRWCSWQQSSIEAWYASSSQAGYILRAIVFISSWQFCTRTQVFCAGFYFIFYTHQDWTDATHVYRSCIIPCYQHHHICCSSWSRPLCAVFADIRKSPKYPE